MRSILLYHIYPINHWKEITDFLFQKLPFHKIVVHVSLPQGEDHRKGELETYFNNYGVHQFLYSANSGKGEVDAMKSFVAQRLYEGFDLLTYMHCKGVTKPDNKNIENWTRLMRYFIIEKMEQCKKVFRKGYVAFGINKTVPNQEDEGFRGSNFFYEGNFVSLNLKAVDLEQAVARHLEDSYYGLEGFWGKLCPYKKGYAIFNSGINHYLLSVAEKDYTSSLGRLRYKMVRHYYLLRYRMKNASKQRSA